MESAAVSAAGWVVGKALSSLSGGFVEAWAASTKLGPNVGAVKMELLHAQGLLHNARGSETTNPALQQQLLHLRDLAYDAEDVLDELDYFRIQDELDGTYEAADEHASGCLHGHLINARHTARNFKKGCLPATCSFAGGAQASRHADDEEAVAGSGCTSKLASSARGTIHLVGKRFSCLSLARGHHDDDDDSTATHIMPTRGRRSKGAEAEQPMKAPKLKFDRVDLSKRMKHIVEQLKLVSDKVSTSLNHAPFLPSIAAMNRPVTTSAFIEPKLYGRTGERRNIINDITQGDYYDKDLTVIPIVGPGGIGKTTLTQHIYQEVQKQFDVKVWVCVSLNFNANKLKEEITKLIPKLTDQEYGNQDDLIEQRLKSKKFLLVLDDMWNFSNEDEWKRLLAPFKKAQTKGNIILVTTRLPAVAEMVKTIGRPIQLLRLEREVFLELFQAYVFVDKKSMQDHNSLLETGKLIAKKLKGSPLAAKTVGRLLRNHLDLDYWTRVLESKEWESQTNDNDIMPALKLSYDYLPFHLQQCFTYCALFPEDYRFDSKEIIHFWIGLDILHSHDQNKRIEDVGLSYLDDLVNYGFFKIDMNEDGSPYYALHDLLHELALKVSSYECLVISSSNVRYVQIPPSIRHLSIVVDHMDVNDRMTFENVKEDFNTLNKRLDVEKLHSLMLFGEYHGSFVTTFGNLLSKSKALRLILLDTPSYAMNNMLHNFSELVHLRYLRIKMGDFSAISLPNTISRFYHLRVLDLQRCSGHFDIPSDMNNLVRLRHFLVQNDSLHSEIVDVGKLKHLQELRMFEVKKEVKAFELRQLGQLAELKGSLGIYKLEKAEGADEAKLLNKSHLHKLTLDWDTGRTKDSSREDLILENLKPHSNLQELNIKGHGGTTCPSWLGANLSIKGLQSLSLDGVDWNTFPPLGKLWLVNENGKESLGCTTNHSFQNLKRLELISIPRLAKWDGNGDFFVFSFLEELTIRDCPELVELPFSHSSHPLSKQEMKLTKFPTLRKLEIERCPKLSSLPPLPWTRAPCHVSIAEVGSNFRLLDYSRNEQSETYLQIRGKDGNVDSAFWKILVFNNITQLKHMELDRCPPLPLEHIHMLSCLRRLGISNSSNALLLVEAESTVRYQFPVEHLRIMNCGCSGKEMTLFLSHFPKLSSFVLNVCEKIKWLGVAEQNMTAMSESSPSGNMLEDAHVGHELQQPRGPDEKAAAAAAGLLLLPRQLQNLDIYYMPQLILQFNPSDDSVGGLGVIREGLQGLCSIQSLFICDRPNFLSSYLSSSSCFPFPSSLQQLWLSGVRGIETLSPLFNLSSLSRLIIMSCEDLRGEGLNYLLAQGKLTELKVEQSPKFFVGSDLSGLQQLETDDIVRVLDVPTCSLLASSLTKLTINGSDVEHFTEEQNAALQLLSSLQDLQFSSFNKLQSLPSGLHKLVNLKSLEVCSCPAIRSLPKGGLPSSLEVLDIQYCKNEELKRKCRMLGGTIPIIRDKAY